MRITQKAGLVAAALALATAVVPAGAFRQDVTLAYKWTKGETLRYRIDQTNNTTMTGMPGMPEIALSQNANQILKMTVDDLTADGVVTLSQVFESMRMDITTPAGKMSIDSAAPNANATPPELITQKIFSALVGSPIRIVLAPSGQVEKIEGYTQLLDKMAATIPADPAAAAAFQNMKAGFGDDQMKAMFSQGFPQFPAKPVKAGDSWSTTLRLPNPALGTTINTVALTLASADGQIAKLVGKVTIETDPKAPPATGMMGMKTELTTANGDAEMLFDVAKGRLRSATTSITMPLSMSGNAPDGRPVNMKMNAKSVVKIELIDK